MIGPAATFECRTARVTKLRTYLLSAYDLQVSGGKWAVTIPLDEITRIRLYTVPGLGLPGVGPIQTPTAHCRIDSGRSGTVDLRSLHYVSFGTFEDRTAALQGFAEQLIVLTRRRNPQVELLAGMPPGMWWSGMVVFAGLAAMPLAVILLGTIGMAMDHTFTAVAAGMFAVIGLISALPLRFLRTLWRLKTRRLEQA